MKTRKEIAQLLGLKASSLNSLLNGTRNVSRTRAIELERKTGINRMTWLYPVGGELVFHLEKWCGDKINAGRGRVT